MNSDLMGPSGLKTAGDPRERLTFNFCTLNALDVCACGFSATARAYAETQRITRIAFNRAVDHFIFWRNTSGQRPIFALNGPLLQLAHQIKLSVLILSHDHQTGGISVQSVHDTRTRQRSENRIVGKQAVEKCIVPMPGRRMNHETGRLVDDEDVLVLVNDIKVHRNRFESKILSSRCQLYPDRVRENHLMTGLDNRFAVHLDRTLFNQSF